MRDAGCNARADSLGALIDKIKESLNTAMAHIEGAKVLGDYISLLESKCGEYRELIEDGQKQPAIKVQVCPNGYATIIAPCSTGLTPSNHHELYPQPVKIIQLCKLGSRGCAYDGPEVSRAYTINDQPSNIPAWRLGCALNNAQKALYGDEIDRGLNLLRALFDKGFGVFEIGKSPVDKQQSEQ